jgi:hypothetical protein
MLGSGISSAAIWTAFDTITTATVRKLKHSLKIAWKRIEDAGATFAVVGTSIVGGIDFVQGQSSIITKPDVFSYDDETEKAMKIEYDREVDEPLGGISLAQADITLDNTDLRFTPNQSQTIGTAILPNRPLQVHLGFEVSSQDKTVPVFKGLSDMPREDKLRRICEVHCYDYLKYLNQYPLESTIYTDQRSDQIILDILTTVGFGSSQYELDTGLNTIGFAWFEKGETAGERIKKICEAEEANFYQDEEGILRFENRRHFAVSPHTDIVWTFNEDDILSWEEDHTVSIINKCIVKAEPREVSDLDEIWRDGIAEEVGSRDTLTIWANFENPCSALTDPVATTDYLANTAIDGSGSDITSGVSIVMTAFAQSAKLEITNSGASTAYLTLLRLRGTPALITSPVKQTYEDTDSISKYEEHQLEIVNDFIANDSFAYYLARAIVRKYKDPLRRARIRVRGVPHLQLKDKVRVYDQDLGTYKNYRVMKIRGQMTPGSFEQTITLREITTGEVDGWAIVGTSAVEGYDVVGF